MARGADRVREEGRMKRRAFVTGTGALSAWPRAALAQAPVPPTLAREPDARRVDAIAATGIPIPAPGPRRADGVRG